MTADQALRLPTISIPEAGAVFFDLSANKSYQAAKRGDIPVIEIGGKKRVPVAVIAERLGLQHSIGRQS